MKNVLIIGIKSFISKNFIDEKKKFIDIKEVKTFVSFKNLFSVNKIIFLNFG